LITEGQPEILSAGHLRDLAEVEKLVGKAKDEKWLPGSTAPAA